MQIFFHRTYVRRFRKLQPAIKRNVEKTILIFKNNPLDPRLQNHALSGPLVGKHAISVMHDLRIIIQEESSYSVVLFLDIGTHDQVY